MAELETQTTWYNPSDPMPNLFLGVPGYTGVLDKTVYVTWTGTTPVQGCVATYVNYTQNTGQNSIISMNVSNGSAVVGISNLVTIIFSMPLTAVPTTITCPNTRDSLSNPALSNAGYTLTFTWVPYAYGSNQVFTFAGVTSFVGTLSAPGISVFPVIATGGSSQTTITNLASTSGVSIVQGTLVNMTATFSGTISSAPTITGPNGDVPTSIAFSSNTVTFNWTPSHAGTNESFTFTGVTGASGPLSAAVTVNGTTITSIMTTTPGTSIVQGTLVNMTATFSTTLTSTPSITGPNEDVPSSITVSTNTVTFNWTPSQAGSNEVFTFTGVTGATGALTSSPIIVIATGPQSLVSLVCQSPPIVKFKMNWMTATFADPLIINPTVTPPNPYDNIQYMSNNPFVFTWYPQDAGTSQQIQFSNVTGYSGTISTTVTVVDEGLQNDG